MTMITPPSDIDAQALATYLAARVDGAGPAVSLTRLGGGQSNPTYFLDTGSRHLVLRKRPAGTLLPSPTP